MDKTLTKQSAVALLDVLGFKGIEAHASSATVAKALVAVRATMSDMADYMSRIPGDHEGKPLVSVRWAWFSDTMFLVAQYPDDSVSTADCGRLLVDCVASTVSATMQLAARSLDFPLVFRGVITFGDAVVEGKDIFFGKAIREAAELYERADGAFVWLTPKAAKVIGEAGAVKRYLVPLKTGQFIDTLVVNPIHSVTDEDLELVHGGFVEAMSKDDVDVVIKSQNTLRFLNDMERRRREYLADLRGG